MLSFKRFDYTAVTLASIELIHQIKKEQFDISVVCSSQLRTPQVWETLLVA